MVSAGPEDSQILSGSPSVRRNFIDIYLSQLSREYLTNLSDYQKVLAQKNAALKRQMDHSAFDAYGFLIEGGEKKIFYTGDFRGHGRKGSLIDRLPDSLPEIDAASRLT